MIVENLKKWESKLIASERRFLITYLVAEVNNLALFDDVTRIGCFRRTGLLVDYTKSSSNDDIKPQGIVSKIVVPESHETGMSDTNAEFASPVETFSPETEHADLHAAGIHPDRVGEDRNAEQELVIEEEEAEELLSTETLDDLDEVDSDDDVGF